MNGKGPRLIFSEDRWFELHRSYEIRYQAKDAGFAWDPDKKCWRTRSVTSAEKLSEYADETAIEAISKAKNARARALSGSSATSSSFSAPAPEGLKYIPFQLAGIEYAVSHPRCLLADEMGLGKTIQAIGVANSLGLERMLIVCPAGMRLTWKREIEKWHIHNPGVDVITSKKSPVNSSKTIIVSYDLLSALPSDLPRFGLVVLDEAHYVKNPKAGRTKLALGSKLRPGAIHKSDRVLALTGTPIPNRVNEIYPLIRALLPEAIDGMSYWTFLHRYSLLITTKYATEVVGSKNEGELQNRLRSAGMVRRLKSEVLTELPPKRYKMVVFGANGEFAPLLEQEAEFSAEQISEQGVPFGSALPAIRREMGIKKAPLCAEYIADMIENGVTKVVVFAHHRDVVAALENALAPYGVVKIMGGSSAEERQNAVDKFQSDPEVRVFVGNIRAAGVGITLTAAQDVVFAETSWTPGENDQASDRAHRVGQLGSVLIHYLVVDGSLDARLLEIAAEKREGIKRMLNC